VSLEPAQISDRNILEFERPIIDLEKKISELRGLSTTTVDFSSEIRKLEQKARKLQKEVFAELTAQQKVQLARHPARPYMLDYVNLLMDDFLELHGDRSFRDDPAIIGGLAQFGRDRCRRRRSHGLTSASLVGVAVAAGGKSVGGDHGAHDPSHENDRGIAANDWTDSARIDTTWLLRGVGFVPRERRPWTIC